jgi:hypothetical protein
MLSRLGVELRDANKPPRPVTLPRINLPPLDSAAIEAEARLAAAKVKTIRAGRDAWEAINKAQSFEGWKAVGAALAVGKAHALKVTGANRAWGRNYSREFGAWVKAHGFEKMPASTRSVAVELHENAEEITAWRDTLPERQRKRLVHPLSVTRRWRASTAHNGKSSTDLRRDAKAAWARFCTCARALPTDDAQPLWATAQAQAAAVLGASAVHPWQQKPDHINVAVGTASSPAAASSASSETS